MAGGVPFDGARRGSVQVGGRVAQPCSVVRTRDRVAGAGYACSARPDLHTICRSFPKISSALSAKVCGGSRIDLRPFEPTKQSKQSRSTRETEPCSLSREGS